MVLQLYGVHVCAHAGERVWCGYCLFSPPDNETKGYTVQVKSIRRTVLS